MKNQSARTIAGTTPVILPLSHRARRKLRTHFLALGAADRRLRFGNAICDETITRYVDSLDLGHDAVFVIEDGRHRIVAAAHVAVSGSTAEVGLSVLPPARGRGLGSALFSHAARHARTHDIVRIDMHFLSENRAIQRIAARAGMQVESSAGESEAYLALRPAQPDLIALADARVPANDAFSRQAA